jgi:hypothetical protein
MVAKGGSSVPLSGYHPRSVDALLSQLLAELPAVMVTGPRATGKTTTAERLAASVVRLDRPAEAVAFRADPDAALAEFDEPILLDEWQEVPEVLGAVKRAVDVHPRPARFILTGSVRADLEAATWPGTGRLVRIPMYGLSVREREGDVRGRPFLDRMASGEVPPLPSKQPDLRGYIRSVLASGFPEPALRLDERLRSRWLDSYLDQLLTRDAAGISPRRDPVKLRRYFETIAINTAGTVADNKLLEAASVNRKTAVAYEQMLADLFVLEMVPAWTTNRLKRLALRSKRYVIDPALAASALGLDVGSILRDGDMLGRLLDTFVAAQLRSELAVCESRPRLYHLRDEHGRREIDLLAELGGADVVAFEVKADAAPDQAAAQHLAWLRERLGDRLIRGVVFHTGPRRYELGERILAVPICALWG